MKVWQVISVLLLSLVLVGSTACNPFGGGSEEEVSQQLVTVVRDDLTVSISGSGNTGVANDAEVTFGVGGKIEKIYVKENDVVSRGDVLAQLDTGALELALAEAGVGVTKAEVGVAQAAVNVAQAEIGVAQAKVNITQSEVSVTQAEVALEVAKYNLDKMEDVAEAKDAIEDAEYEVKVAEAGLKEANYLGGGDDSATRYWRSEVVLAQTKLAEAQQDLAEILADPDYSGVVLDEVKIKQLQVEAAEQTLEQTRQTLEQTRRSAELAQQTLEQTRRSAELAQQTLEQTQRSREQAQKQLDEATITAPFDGIIASVYADEGDTILATTKIVHLIDIASMELKISVDEIDIPNVRLNQRAIISVDALPDEQFEGKVTSIGLLPTVEAGIVSYEVTIGLDVSQDSGLKVGMSATADIIIDKRSNVLLVPGRAVTQDKQGNSVVRVMIGEQIQPRVVVLGITDGIQTEIVEGLQEGDVVVLGTQAKPRSSGQGLFFGGRD